MDGLKCPHCKGRLNEPIDGQYECPRCEVRGQIPYTQDGTVYYNKPASRLKALTFPAVSLIGVLVFWLDWAPFWPTLGATILAYVFLDSLVWASGGGASKAAAIAMRIFLVAIAAGVAYFQLGG